MPEIIQVTAKIINMNPRADRSWRISFETRELSGDEVKVLADNFQGEGWLVFKPNADVNPAEIPQEAADSGTKSQSQRLRDVIYILWRQQGGKGDFQSFYNVYLEKLIEFTKSKLSEEDNEK